MKIALRAVLASDLPLFYQQQRDPLALAMAAFAPRNWQTFMQHWHQKVLDQPEVTVTTITVAASGSESPQVSGYVVCWPDGNDWLIGYWLDRHCWGQGIGTAALQLFLPLVSQRPLSAYVARHNIGSLRVLEKCGFQRVLQTDMVRDDSAGSEPTQIVEAYLLRLQN